ncbi:MAG TPA: DUF3347 domain-containing protein [Chitinophagaceae bacterium]|nr:DUF3347 domain-containing protein [Chitinophagaceae bacterium]
MKKGLFLIGVVVVAFAVYYIFFNNSESPANDGPKQQPLAQSKNSDIFNNPFNAMLNAYYGLHDALVNWDTAQATAKASSLQTLLAKVPFDSLKADTIIIMAAKSVASNIDADCIGLTGDSSILEKRRSFDELSENLYNLLRTVKYDQQIIYHMRCPMAFGEDKEGFWLTNVDTIINPYLGTKHPKYKAAMINCGNIEDSLDFRSK